MAFLFDYNSVACLASVLMGAVLSFFLLRIRNKTTNTWLLTWVFVLFTLVMVDTFIMLSVRADWTLYGVYVLVLLDVILALLIQFAYRFPNNDHPREARVALVLSLINAGVIGTMIVRTLDFGRSGRLEDFTEALWPIFYIQGARLAAYLWFLSVWVRKLILLEADFGRPIWLRILSPESADGQSIRAFLAAFIVGLFLWPSQVMVQFRIITQAQQGFFFVVFTLLLFSLFFLIYINTSPEQTSFMDKVLGVTLLFLLIAFTFTSFLSWRDRYDDFYSARLQDVATTRRALRENQLEHIPPEVCYAVVRPFDAHPTQLSYRVLYQREDNFDIAFLSNWDRETYMRLAWFWHRRMRLLTALPRDEADLQAELTVLGMFQTLMKRDERMTDLDLVNLRDHYYFYRFSHGDDLYEVGFSYLEYRRAMHEGVRNQAAAMCLFTLLVMFSFPLLFRNAVVTPLEHLLTGVKRVNQGDFSTRVPIRARDELGYLGESFNHMVHSISQARAQLESNAKTLAAQNRALSELDKLKDEFLANTSHELRTPLHGMIGLAESLRNGVAGHLPPKAKYDLGLIVTGGRRLAALVNDILDFSKLQHRDLHLNRGSVDMRVLADVVLRIAEPLIGAKQLLLENAVSADLPPVYGDEDRLHQILLNLVGNAVKFTEYGCVLVTAFVDRNAPGFLTVQVVDSGIGIPQEKQTMVFESFEQAQGDDNRHYGGTGLGLAIVKKLVELHGGRVWLESQEGRGSTFSFTVPLSNLPSENRLQESETINEQTRRAHSELLEVLEDGELPTEKPISPLAGSFRVLVVDDEAVNRKVLVNMLSLYGYHSHEVGSGAAALQALAEEAPFDLVLLDVMMPGMSGYEVCRLLRKDFSIRDLPVIFLTAKSRPTDLQAAFESGANDFLTKPISQTELISRVNLHLSLKIMAEENQRQVRERTLLESENRRKSEELEKARRLQLSMLPATIPAPDWLDIAVFMKPATEVGGDYYDFLADGPRHLRVVVGDATGHGLQAGTMVTAAKSLFLASAVSSTPGEFLKHSSDSLSNMGFQDLYMAMLRLDLDGFHCRMASAGMPFPLWYRAAEQKVESLECGGLPLGSGLPVTYRELEFRPAVGDVLFLASDGLEECFNSHDEPFGQDRIGELLAAHHGEDAQTLVSVLIGAVEAWGEQQAENDDITMVILKCIAEPPEHGEAAT